MKIMHDARLLDQQGRVLEAIPAYEQCISNGTASFDDHINLAVCYFSIDGSFRWSDAPLNILAAAWERPLQILDDAMRRFGERADLQFWRRYMASIRLDDGPLTESQCLTWLHTATTLEPYFVLLGMTIEDTNTKRRTAYQPGAKALYEIVKNGETERRRYVRAVLEGINRGYRDRFLPEYTLLASLD